MFGAQGPMLTRHFTWPKINTVWCLGPTCNLRETSLHLVPFEVVRVEVAVEELEVVASLPQVVS